MSELTIAFIALAASIALLSGAITPWHPPEGEDAP